MAARWITDRSAVLEEAMEQRMVTDVALLADHASGGPRHSQQALHMLLFELQGHKNHRNCPGTSPDVPQPTVARRDATR